MTSQQVLEWTWEGSLSPLTRTLDSGGMLAIPTESTYGLAADPRDAHGVDTILRFKRRPPGMALPVVLADVDQLDTLGADPSLPWVAEVASLWPAALTLIVELEQPLPASAGRPSLAVRVPAHDRLRSLLARLGRALTATSANLSGQPPVSQPSELLRMLEGWNCVIVDDGDLPGGPASTIIEFRQDAYRVLRPGAVSLTWLRERLSRPVFSAVSAEIPADDRRRSR